jgi:formylmethanofuran dehydrogenase subunit E
VKSFDELLHDAEVAHGHLCAGQVLGVRLAMRGIVDPHGKDRKRLFTFVEIDRCATDAVAVVTGCRLGKRALKFRDWGKVAATFVDLNSGRAVRVCAKESSKALARQMHPEIENKNQQQMLAYREIPNDDLFTARASTSSARCSAMAGFCAAAVPESAITKRSPDFVDSLFWSLLSLGSVWFGHCRCLTIGQFVAPV